jgi:hypothetical protein
MPALDSLDQPVAVDPAARDDLAAKGHAVVRGLGPPEAVAAIRPVVEDVMRRRQRRVGALEDRDTYGQAFLQVGNLWQHDEDVRRFVCAPRFAQAAADLLGVDGVRLYHDQALLKEPGGGRTPWHQDQVYWPLDTDDTVTMWMPLVDVPAEVGSMTFASGSHRRGNLGEHLIGDESDAVHGELVDRLGLRAETHGGLAAGDATFHRGWTLHRAPANPTAAARPVMTVIYFADGTRVGPLDSEARRFDCRTWLGGAAEGEPAAGPLNPRLWPLT